MPCRCCLLLASSFPSLQSAETRGSLSLSLLRRGCVDRVLRVFRKLFAALGSSWRLRRDPFQPSSKLNLNTFINRENSLEWARLRRGEQKQPLDVHQRQQQPGAFLQSPPPRPPFFPPRHLPLEITMGCGGSSEAKSSGNDYDHLFKLVLVGEVGVGKSSLVRQIILY